MPADRKFSWITLTVDRDGGHSSCFMSCHSQRLPLDRFVLATSVTRNLGERREASGWALGLFAWVGQRKSRVAWQLRPPTTCLTPGMRSSPVQPHA